MDASAVIESAMRKRAVPASILIAMYHLEGRARAFDGDTE